MKVAVVTPTINKPELVQCLNSVEDQTYRNFTHYIFVDGEEQNERNTGVRNKVFRSKCDSDRLKFIDLQENVGRGWYGHRVYAACSFLVNADIIVYLDEDNWLEPNHLEEVVKVIGMGYDWTYSLRNICEKDGNFICQDNCESLGVYPVYGEDRYHIDTSCFAIRRDVAVRIGHAWYGQWGADRQFGAALKYNFKNFIGTGKYSVNYRLDGNQNSVKKEYFLQKNELQAIRYKDEGTFPWTHPAKPLNTKISSIITL